MIDTTIAPDARPAARPDPGRPAWERPALAAVLLVAALLYLWDIQDSQYHAFYADAVRSMSESWKAFWYGSFDPGSSITIDKLPGFLWPQALSARVFGFHPWSLTLPQVAEGVLSVWVLFRVVRRWAGPAAGLVAAAAFTLTPVAAGLFRSAVEDASFTLLLLLAADAAQRAARSGRLRSLVVAGVWVGLAFQTKMLEAWAVLPALALVYLVSAPLRLRRRLGHLAVAGAVCVAVSASWVLLVTLTPANDRPYVDGTTDNSAVSMVVGYNFLNRFSSLGLSAADTGSVAASRGGPGGGGHAFAGGGAARAGQSGGSAGGRGRAAGYSGGSGAAAARHRAGFGGSQDGWGKMFTAPLTSQTGWLYPVAALAAVCGVAWRRGTRRTDPERAGYLLWGSWLVTFMLVFSAGSVGGHTYYMGVVAAPLAALTGAGTLLFWRARRQGRARAWALPAAVAGTVAWSAVVALGYPSFLPWLAPAAALLGVAALVLLALRRGRRVAVLGLAAGVAAMLLPSAAWAASVFDARYGESAMGSVGPVANGFGGGARGGFLAARAGGGTRVRALGEGPWGGGRFAGRRFGDGGTGRGEGFRGAGGFGGFGGGSSGGLSSAQRELLAYATAHQDGARYVMAATSWSAASPYVLDAGASVLPMGGFTGQAPFPTLTGFRRLVADGEVRYVLLGQGGRAAGTAGSVGAWVRDACHPVSGQDGLYHCA